MGTGPFMLADWKVEQQMVFKRHPNYFRKGLPYVDEVVIRTIPDEANIVAALRAGQIHHAFIEDNKNLNLLKDEKTLTGYRARGSATTTSTSARAAGPSRTSGSARPSA